MTARTEGGSRPRSRERFHFFTSLRAEVVLGVATLATVALALAAATIALLGRLATSRHGALYLALLIVVDLAVFVVAGAYRMRRLLIEPIESLVAATEAIAAGNLERRVPPGTTVEMARLSRGINRLTARLLEDQAQRAHLDKVASVGRLASGVARELDYPLGAISGYTQLLRAWMDGDAGAADALAGIVRETARITDILHGMLEYARRRPRTAEPVDLNETARRVIAMLTDQGALRAVRMRLALDAELPALIADPHDVEQVVVNLLLNAITAMNGDGTITVVSRRIPVAAVASGSDRRDDDVVALEPERTVDARVRAWLHSVGDVPDIVTLVVADSGPGVPWSESERVFDPFVGTKEPGQGTGLGLAVVARIVEGLGGTVWVRQAREGGAAFVIYFPVRPAPPEPPPPEVPAATPAETIEVVA